MNFTIAPSIPDVFIINPDIYQDERGFFMETYQIKRFTAAGIANTFVQDNHAGSRQGTLRGLHYQIKHPQGKLIRAVVGEIYDVAVDLRRSSPTFGRWVGEYLSADNKLQLWLPPGFAHGYYVLSEWAEVLYKVTDYYAPEWERTLLWNDAEIKIEWPIPEGQKPILSHKDELGLPLNQAELFE
jgi:dTDP-4-dehydrorhamnose 3,5-epimerase